MTGARATVLERILTETRHELERRKREAPLESLAAQTAGTAPSADQRRFHAALSAPGTGVIAEFKRRSPSAGELRERPSLPEIVRAYERGGAVAASILTEGPHFDGSLQDLADARAACALPLLRKDFVVDPYQLHEALLAGADAVLLIVAALEDEQLASLHESAMGMGLDVLVEVHDREELERALELDPKIVGVNNRDLRDFSVDVERTAQLMDRMPPGVLVVSESGIGDAAQLKRLQEQGVHAVLVGETLMRASDPAVALRDLRSFKNSSAEI